MYDPEKVKEDFMHHFDFSKFYALKHGKKDESEDIDEFKSKQIKINFAIFKRKFRAQIKKKFSSMGLYLEDENSLDLDSQESSSEEDVQNLVIQRKDLLLLENQESVSISHNSNSDIAFGTDQRKDENLDDFGAF